MREGKLAKRIDAEYFRRQVERIRYWSGSDWVAY